METLDQLIRREQAVSRRWRRLDDFAAAEEARVADGGDLQARGPDRYAASARRSSAVRDMTARQQWLAQDAVARMLAGEQASSGGCQTGGCGNRIVAEPSAVPQVDLSRVGRPAVTAQEDVPGPGRGPDIGVDVPPELAPLAMPCPLVVRFDPPEVFGGCPIADGDCVPPCVYPDLFPCDVATLPVEEAAGNFDWIWVVADRAAPVDYEIIDLVTLAWAFLLRNIDVVRWVACVVYGEGTGSDNLGELFSDIFGVPGSVAECLQDKIVGRQARVRLEFTTEVKGFFGGTGLLSGGFIQVPVGTGGAVRSRYLKRFRQAAAGSADQFCIVADLAATLLHELVHTCMTSGYADNVWDPVKQEWVDESNECTTSYMIENAFRWAMGQRFSCLEETDCWFYGCDEIWLNDGASYPDDPPWPGKECPAPGPGVPPSGGGGMPPPPPQLIDQLIHEDPDRVLILDGTVMTWTF